MKSSVNNNRADQSDHLQSRSQQQRSRSVSSSAKSCVNNDSADQPAHSRSHNQLAHLQSGVGIWYAN